MADADAGIVVLDDVLVDEKRVSAHIPFNQCRKGERFLIYPMKTHAGEEDGALDDVKLGRISILTHLCCRINPKRSCAALTIRLPDSQRDRAAVRLERNWTISREEGRRRLPGYDGRRGIVFSVLTSLAPHFTPALLSGRKVSGGLVARLRPSR